MAVSGPDIQNLSSNWKALQQTLKKNDASQPVKRKADAEAPKTYNATRRKLGQETKFGTSNKLQKRSWSDSMGGSWSTSQQPAPSTSLALWAEDNGISAKDVAAAYGTSLKNVSLPTTETKEDRINEGLSTTAEAGKYVAVDCEMVGVGPKPDEESALARISIVNFHGDQLYDSFVQTKEPVTDYRTHVSGITNKLLQGARTLETVQADVAKLLDSKVLVGHALRNDLDALLLSHPKRDIRDTSKHPAFRQLAAGQTPSLKKLARQVLGVDIQVGEHSSIEDARAAMLLFRREKENFERLHIAKWGSNWKVGGPATSGEAKEAKANKKKKKNKKKKNKKKKGKK